MGKEAEKKKLAKAQAALDKMGDDVYQLYCELDGMSKEEAINRLLIHINTDELISAIDDIWFEEV